MERFLSPICASSMRPPSLTSATWTSSSQHASTAPGLWRKRLPRVSPCTAARKTLRVCAAFWTNANSPQESFRYEHRTRPSRRLESAGLQRSGNSLSLHCRAPLRLLPRPPVPRVHRRSLGQTDHDFLEQARNQTTCSHGVLSQERRGLSPLRAAALPADRERKP